MASETTVRPALTADEWAWATSAGFPRLDLRVEGAHGTRFELHGPPMGLRDHVRDDDSRAKMHMVAALLNASLPDGDPRKLTRETVRAMRAAAKVVAGQASGMAGASRAAYDGIARDLEAAADAIAALLPPREEG